ncbi:hypothetical protein [Streptomyces sindenensis]|uniref:hypothetical protein n=1 Tax=Streptomyces sindenensis TaxID=67363 RepID=UPI001679D25E|nr:hypothetical protein [Streptomyces sindenensis]GGP56291.1 hypothetical protein GCM10010231_29130 [Streptomyces sindenensis]
MDAGLAAVLGATVGALGTAVTGAAAALLTRSTARHQVKAEAFRTLRESRRATYTSFAETSGRYLEMLSTTLIPLERVERFPDQRNEWIEDAHKRWKKALRYRQNEVQRERVLLRLDATRPVADAAQEVAKRCVLLSRATGRAIAANMGQDLDTGPLTPPSPGYIELLAEDGLDPETPDLDRLQSEARDAYNAFLRTAAHDLGENGLLA